MLVRSKERKAPLALMVLQVHKVLQGHKAKKEILAIKVLQELMARKVPLVQTA
jgi:hypothetical protein